MKRWTWLLIGMLAAVWVRMLVGLRWGESTSRIEAWIWVAGLGIVVALAIFRILREPRPTFAIWGKETRDAAGNVTVDASKVEPCADLRPLIDKHVADRLVWIAILAIAVIAMWGYTLGPIVESVTKRSIRYDRATCAPTVLQANGGLVDAVSCVIGPHQEPKAQRPPAPLPKVEPPPNPAPAPSTDSKAKLPEKEPIVVEKAPAVSGGSK